MGYNIPKLSTDNLAIGGSTASDSPLFYNDSEEKLTLTNTTGGLSFQVNDELTMPQPL